jgi:hypothetical protein
VRGGKDTVTPCPFADVPFVVSAMRYVLTVGGSPDAPAADTDRADAIARWWAEHREAGRIVAGVWLRPPLTATTLRFHPSRRQPVVCDGPCTAESDAIGGYSVIDVDDLDEALALARSWPGGGYVEIRPILAMTEGETR